MGVRKPMKTFHEEKDSLEKLAVLRISFHGESHYNSVVIEGWKPENCVYSPKEAGEVEQEAIQYSLDGKWNNKKEEEPDSKK